jgi:hypothetical protein
MNKNKIAKYNHRWVLIVTVSTVILASFFSFISDSVLRNLNIYFAFLTLAAIIFVGVIFDIIGVAAAVANESVFHAMASKKVEISKYCLFITKNAARVSSFCSDVIGDIAGIVSGAAGTVIIIILINDYGLLYGSFFTILMSSGIAGLTVGGKAMGKDLAINKSKEIVLAAAKIIRQFHKLFNFKV